MRIAYFDIFAGISGDMCLGALIDAGCPAEALKDQLGALQIPHFDLRWEKVIRGPLTGTKADVIVHEEHHVHRHLHHVLEIVDRIQWPGHVRQTIEATFTALAKAEGEVHGKPYDKIHFHEVGSYDAIIDISGTLLALHLMNIEKCFCSRIHEGTGLVKTQHGLLPVPVPATASLLRGFELYTTGREMEMVTPTGAALMRVLAGASSPMPAITLEQIGYGAGSRESSDLPNMLRVFIGETQAQASDFVTVLESNIDDMNPEFFEPLMQRLFEAGAVDVAFSPIYMKKNRPATQLCVIMPPALRETIAQIVLQESTSIGVRFYECQRRVLQRKACHVHTAWGSVHGKVVWGHGVEKRFTPEYESCLQIHKEHGVPIAQVYREAIQNFYQEEHHHHHE